MAKDVEWHWTEHQDQAFQRIRQLVTKAPVLPVEPCQTPRPDTPK